MHFRLATDTSTLLMCDPARLKHRLSDSADWWCWPPEEQLKEVNEGNAAFVDLGSDGVYEVQVVFGAPGDGLPLVRLACPTGTLFIGAGEEATSEGLEPEAIRGGCFVKVVPGSVTVHIARGAGNSLKVVVASIAGEARNSFDKPLELA